MRTININKETTVRINAFDNMTGAFDIIFENGKGDYISFTAKEYTHVTFNQDNEINKTDASNYNLTDRQRLINTLLK